MSFTSTSGSFLQVGRDTGKRVRMRAVSLKVHYYFSTTSILCPQELVPFLLRTIYGKL